MKCGLVWEWIPRANPHFFINNISKFEAAMIRQIFHLFIHEIAKIFAIFCFFRKVFTLFFSGNNFGNLTVVHASTNSHNSVQVSCTPKCLFCGFALFWRTKWVSLNSSIKKTPSSLIMFLSASWLSSTMQDILLQKSLELKMESRKSFGSKQKSSPVT